MASTYSTNLALELIGTGDQSGTWGTTTNTNLGTLIEQAISGYVTQAITDGSDTTITIPNGATGVARNMALELTGTLTAARNLIVPANKKLYLIYNNTTGGYAVTVKVSGQTGISVPNGKKVWLLSNGTDVVLATNYLVGDISGNAATATSAGTLSAALAVSLGGTNLTSYTIGDIIYASGATTLSKLADVATGNALISGGVATAPSWGKIGLTTHVSGTLPVANGGTGVTSSTGSGNVVLSASPALTGTPTAGGVEIGYRSVPRSATSGTTATTSERGYCYAATGTMTIPASTFAAGDAFSIYNNSASAITITQGSGLTLRQAGTGNTGSRTLAAYGLVTLWFNSATEAVISGAGLS